MKILIVLCILIIGLLVLSGCATMDAFDKSLANAINQSNGLNQEASQDQPAQPEPAPAQTVKVKAIFKSVNVRSEPSKQSSVVTALPGGIEVAKIDENDNWTKVQLEMEDGSQKIGWVSNELLEK